MKNTNRIAIVGGGPSALFLYRSLLELPSERISVTIFEARSELGSGMPYSAAGASPEHATNVSGNEVPSLIASVTDWIKSLPAEQLAEFNLDADRLTEFKVMPRLLFGRYLAAQFERLLTIAEQRGLQTSIMLQTKVVDVSIEPGSKDILVTLGTGDIRRFDKIIFCTGHIWPREHEGMIPGYFESPYPPQKLARVFDHPIALRGASLTAIDAVRTLARAHGEFVRDAANKLAFIPSHKHFKIVMHSREGFLPGIRFHLEDPRLSQKGLLSELALTRHRDENDGYISLDYLFDHDFKMRFKEREPGFYALIETLKLEEFVEMMMKERERTDAFTFFKREYAEAAASIRNEESILWKEKLAILSYALNYPAKYFSAEDTLRLQRVLAPLISVVIAFAPQQSCEELIALHDAGRLEMVAVGKSSWVEPQQSGGVIYHYEDDQASEAFATFVDCVGQKPLSYEQFPFPSLKADGTVSEAVVRFRSRAEAEKEAKDGAPNVVLGDSDCYLKVPGIAIGDDFQVRDGDGTLSEQIFNMAVPLMGGHNPDYSGLDFCEEAAKKIVSRIESQMSLQATEEERAATVFR